MNIHKTLIKNGIDWYVVRKTDGSHDLQHSSGLSAVLDCGEKPQNYSISDLQQCWGGDDFGNDCIYI